MTNHEERVTVMEEETLKMVFQDLYKAIKEDVSCNGKILISYAGANLTSIEATALLFSNCILEDIEMVEQMKRQGVDHRYSDGIIRGMCEQVIEFIYLFHHPDLLPEYYGTNKSDREVDDIANEDDLFLAIRKLIGDKRYTSGRNILHMAEDIGEKYKADDELSLYEVYQWISTNYHNSYREHLNDLIGECEEEAADAGRNVGTQEAADTEEHIEEQELDYLMMTTILTAFMDTYETIVKNLNSREGDSGSMAD